jgi:hypothetical protein
MNIACVCVVYVEFFDLILLRLNSRQDKMNSLSANRVSIYSEPLNGSGEGERLADEEGDVEFVDEVVGDVERGEVTVGVHDLCPVVDGRFSFSVRGTKEVLRDIQVS